MRLIQDKSYFKLLLMFFKMWNIFFIFLIKSNIMSF